MDIFIRRIVSEDAPAITLLSNQLGYPISAEQTLKNINAVLANKDHDAFIAMHEEQIIAWMGVSYAIQIESPPICELRGLIVDEKYRKMGIGKMLIEKAKQWCREKGSDTLRLRCNVKRTATHLFYQHLGFREIKQQKVFAIDLK